jgi:hypothetical protein
MKDNTRIKLFLSAIILCFALSYNTFTQDVPWWQSWEKHPENPILESGPNGGWYELLFDPVVIHENDTFKMWFGAIGDYTARQVGHATSVDGIDWNIHPFPVIHGGATGDWDKHKGPGTVIRVDDTLKMWYYGMPGGLENSAVGYAWSLDGIDWEKYSGNPVLVKGPPGSWDDYGVGYVPKVWYDGTTYHMWYGAIVETMPFEKFEIGYATSPDGIHWEKDTANNPVIQRGPYGSFYDERMFPGIPVHYEGQLHMLFSGSDGDSLMYRYTRIGHAFSDDKVNWTIDEDTAMDVGLPGTWDADRVYISSTVYHEGRYKAWYCGVGVDNMPQIGYAYSDSVYQCAPGGLTFTSQAEIDEFPNTYYYCTEILGDVIINGSDINNLYGLSQITSIGGDLKIYGNDVLTNLAGLDNVAYLGGSLKIGDSTNFGTIGNPALTDLLDLNENLSINGNLFIAYNNSLSACHATAICEYLNNPPGNINIHDNAVGCNSHQEVKSICFPSVDEFLKKINFNTYPNPSSGELHLRFSLLAPRSSLFEMYSIQGMKVRTLLDQVQQPGAHELSIDISDLPAGMYFVRMQIDMQVETVKVVKASSRL